jgi:hypothetical protein
MGHGRSSGTADNPQDNKNRTIAARLDSELLQLAGVLLGGNDKVPAQDTKTRLKSLIKLYILIERII